MSAPTLVDRGWRLVFRTAYPLARLWWRVRRRPHRGALVALSVDGAVLLVRASYRPEWSLPGGGVEPGEDPAEAAAREMREELGLSLALDTAPVVVTGRWDGRPETVSVFELALAERPALRLDGREVIGAEYFPAGAWAGLRLSGPARAYLAARRAGTPACAT